MMTSTYSVANLIVAQPERNQKEVYPKVPTGRFVVTEPGPLPRGVHG